MDLVSLSPPVGRACQDRYPSHPQSCKVRYCYYIECPGCGYGDAERPDAEAYHQSNPTGRCNCISLDRFWYSIGNGSTICLVRKSTRGLFLATPSFLFNSHMRWIPLPVGGYAVWRSGWDIDVVTPPTGHEYDHPVFSYLESTRYVPPKAFLGLKRVIQLLKIARGVFIQESPLRFCGGREVLRLSQTGSALMNVGRGQPACSFADVVRALASVATPACVAHTVDTDRVCKVRLPLRYDFRVLRLFIRTQCATV